MEIRNIITFLRIAELQSFSRAAEQLGYSQSAVTVQIRHLERELGTQLFERIGRRVRMTEDGIRFMSCARDVMKAVHTAEHFTGEHENPSGTLRVGIAESLLISVLPPVITEFRQRCPQVEMSTHTGTITELFDMVRQNDVDILYFLDKQIYDPEWIKEAEQREPIVFTASSGHPLAGEKNIPLERVLEEPLLLTEKGVSYRYELEQILAADGMEVHPFLETGNTDVITKLLLDNIGISFLPEYVIRSYVASGQLCILDTACKETMMWSQLVYHKNKWITPQMEVFMDVMKKRAFQEEDHFGTSGDKA